MTPVDISELLGHLQAAYPHARLEEETPAVWFQHLQFVDRLDAEVVVFRWIDNEPRFPSVSQILAGCREEARAARLADTPRAEHVEAPELDMGDDPVPGDVRQSFVDACRAALAVAQRGGGEEAAVAAFAAHAPTSYPSTRVTYPCRCGEGQGWMVVLSSGLVHPCPDCRPELHELWLGGHLASGHRCAECRARSVG